MTVPSSSAPRRTLQWPSSTSQTSVARSGSRLLDLYCFYARSAQAFKGWRSRGWELTRSCSFVHEASASLHDVSACYVAATIPTTVVVCGADHVSPGYDLRDLVTLASSSYVVMTSCRFLVSLGRILMLCPVACVVCGHSPVWCRVVSSRTFVPCWVEEILEGWNFVRIDRIDSMTLVQVDFLELRNSELQADQQR